MKIEDLSKEQRDKICKLLEDLNDLELFRMCMLYNAHFKNIVTDEVREFSIEASKILISGFGEGLDKKDPEKYFDMQINQCAQYIGCHHEKRKNLHYEG
jgi:hypothetical protein